jgi:pimeloyl-ACP methyl ester carboxylesterase
MPVLHLSDIALHYEVDGDGPPLLLIAGMASDSASWQPLMPLLTDRFTVIRPDNRTTGRTIPWDAPVSIGHGAADCLALLDHLGFGRAHLLGHSMGGMIALQLANVAQERAASLTLAASAPLRMARNVALFRALLDIRQSQAAPDLWLRAFFPWLFAPALFDDPEVVDAAVAAALEYPHAQSVNAMRHQLTALDAFDPGALAATCPLQALLAENDLLIPEREARAAWSSLDGVRIHRVAGVGHSIHWDAPHEVAEHVAAFAALHPI